VGKLTIDQPELAGGELALRRCRMMRRPLSPVTQPELADAGRDGSIRAAKADGETAGMEFNVQAEHIVLGGRPWHAGSRGGSADRARQSESPRANANRLGRPAERSRGVRHGAVSDEATQSLVVGPGPRAGVRRQPELASARGDSSFRAYAKCIRDAAAAVALRVPAPDDRVLDDGPTTATRGAMQPYLRGVEPHGVRAAPQLAGEGLDGDPGFPTLEQQSVVFCRVAAAGGRRKTQEVTASPDLFHGSLEATGEQRGRDAALDGRPQEAIFEHRPCSVPTAGRDPEQLASCDQGVRRSSEFRRDR
jgi:hypothetical protein